MAVFPTRAAHKLQLADDLVAGMRANPELFQGCPVTAEQVARAVAKVRAADMKKMEAKAQGVGATAERRQAEKEMNAVMKQTIRHAENLAQGNAGKLKSIGWSAPRPRGRSARTGRIPPGQVHVLEVVEQGRDSVSLRWKAPADGGRVAAYNVQRRQGDSDWIFIGSSTECAALLQNQPQGVALLYQVVAMNSAGEGTPSNAMRVVL